MPNFLQKFFNTKGPSNLQEIGFLNALKRERSIDILIERVNKALSTHQNT